MCDSEKYIFYDYVNAKKLVYIDHFKNRTSCALLSLLHRDMERVLRTRNSSPLQNTRRRTCAYS